MDKVRVGRYCIKKYDPMLVSKLLAMHRHVYSVCERDGKQYVYDFEHNAIPEKILVTDKRIGLTSSQDRMSVDILKDMLYFVDKTIAWT